jgi:hypothetical protein
MSARLASISDYEQATSRIPARPEPEDAAIVRRVLATTGNTDLSHYFFGGDAA